MEQQARDGYFIPNLAHFMVPPKADPLRVSQTVKRLNDTDGDYSKGQPKGKRDDVELLSNDQELVFYRGDDAKPKDGDSDNLTPGNDKEEALDKKEIPKF